MIYSLDVMFVGPVAAEVLKTHTADAQLSGKLEFETAFTPRAVMTL